jgi:hypothetical protein
MIEKIVNYYCDASLQKTDDEKWLFLLRMVLYESDLVQFNVLKKDFDNIPEIVSISKYIVDTAKPIQKIYPRRNFIRYTLHEDVKMFILSKRYMDWKNYYLEDISFFKNDLEIFATITHENYVIMLLNEAQYNDLNSKGYNFTYFLPAKYLIRGKLKR